MPDPTDREFADRKSSAPLPHRRPPPPRENVSSRRMFGCVLLLALLLGLLSSPLFLLSRCSSRALTSAGQSVGDRDK